MESTLIKPGVRWQLQSRCELRLARMVFHPSQRRQEPPVLENQPLWGCNAFPDGESGKFGGAGATQFDHQAGAVGFDGLGGDV